MGIEQARRAARKALERTYEGRDYHLHDFTPEVEAVMVDSLKQGKNLIPKTFPRGRFIPLPE